MTQKERLVQKRIIESEIKDLEHKQWQKEQSLKDLMMDCEHTWSDGVSSINGDYCILCGKEVD